MKRLFIERETAAFVITKNIYFENIFGTIIKKTKNYSITFFYYMNIINTFY